MTDGRAAYVRSEDSTLTIGVDHIAVAPDAGERIATDDPDVRIPSPELVEDGCRSVTGEYARSQVPVALPSAAFETRWNSNGPW